MMRWPVNDERLAGYICRLYRLAVIVGRDTIR